MIIETQIDKAAAAIANARIMRRGSPPITNVLDLLPPEILAEVREDAQAALIAGLSLESGRAIKLEWNTAEGEMIANVPAEDHHGLGHFSIHAIERPTYCDRGKWHVLIEPHGVAAPDDQEAFPRHYFKLENLLEEMEIWANERESCRRAAKLPVL